MLGPLSYFLTRFNKQDLKKTWIFKFKIIFLGVGIVEQWVKSLHELLHPT